jgi:hypothetical protein
MTTGHESRAATPGLGKCTEEIKTVVPEQVRDELVALAVINGMKPAEYLRDLIIEHLYGSLNAARLRAGRRNGMAESGRTGGES